MGPDQTMPNEHHESYDVVRDALVEARECDRFPVLKENAQEYLPPEAIEQLERAYEFAKKAHEGQKRKSGEDFIIHPVEAAIILSEMHLDCDSLTAALLHDTVEDSSVTLEEVEELFSKDIAELVDGVTKLTRLEIENLSDQQANNLRKMFVAMAKDIRVVIIKLADRLHNMRTLSALREDRRIFKSRETMEIYAPLAHRLGLTSIKWELEDLAFFYLEPEKYRQVSKMVAESRAEREAYLQEAIDLLAHELDEANIKARIMGRPKHLYSIYQKMTSKGRNFSEIYDLIALRVIVDTVADCYGALGVTHTLWTPMPNRFKDYIALPKMNMYRSLHTSVIGPAGQPLEVQIRTEEMHRQSEYGIAAHWRYKEGDDLASASLDERLSWVREILDWQTETSDSREFLQALKIDLFNKEVFVFTPKGDVISLRAGSTPIDFAYAIHTEVGHHCIGAKVNGIIVPLAYELQMGDRVEVLTQKNSAPKHDWLGIVKTPGARAKIRSYFSKQTRDVDLARGRELLTKEIRRNGTDISIAQATRYLRKMAGDYNCETEDDVFVAIGSERLSPRAVFNHILRAIVRDATANTQDTSNIPMLGTMVPNKPVQQTHTSVGTHKQTGVTVRGLEDLLVRLSQCCSPAPGDEICGFVTRGRGVSVHRADCPNAIAMAARNPERVIDVAWDSAVRTLFSVEVVILANDRMRLLMDVINSITEAGVNILSTSSITHRDSICEIHIKFEIGDISRLKTILQDLRAVPGVFEARRSLPSFNAKKEAAKEE